MQYTMINLLFFMDTYGKTEQGGLKNLFQAHQQSFWKPLVLQKPLTKKRLRVNSWLLLYVYVLPTGYSKIGLVPADQLHAQRERALLCQALFGPTPVRNRLRPPDLSVVAPLGRTVHTKETKLYESQHS